MSGIVVAPTIGAIGCYSGCFSASPVAAVIAYGGCCRTWGHCVLAAVSAKALPALQQ